MWDALLAGELGIVLGKNGTLHFLQEVTCTSKPWRHPESPTVNKHAVPSSGWSHTARFLKRYTK
jgi:hypothetical protein